MYNKGFNKVIIGKNKYKAYNKYKETKCYKVWKGMLERCYSSLYHERYPSYKDCIIDESWLNFQVFAEWFYNNYVEGYCLDKDILVNGNKLYSPETCCFVPKEINLLFKTTPKGKYSVGVIKRDGRFQAYINKYNVWTYISSHDTAEQATIAYKIAKEAHIKEVADKYKDCVPIEVYNAMYNYQIALFT